MRLGYRVDFQFQIYLRPNKYAFKIMLKYSIPLERLVVPAVAKLVFLTEQQLSRQTNKLKILTKKV